MSSKSSLFQDQKIIRECHRNTLPHQCVRVNSYLIGIEKYINKHGKDAIGHLLIVNDLDGVPNTIKKKYKNITFRITGNITTTFKPEGDDDSWQKNRILKNPIKTMYWKYKSSFKDLTKQSTAANVAANKEFDDYNPTIHVGIPSKAKFVKEWLSFKQRFYEQTYYYNSYTDRTTVVSALHNKFSVLLRSWLILTFPMLGIPITLAITAVTLKTVYDMFNDPMEVEAYAAFFIENKKREGVWSKPGFRKLFKTDDIVSKEEFSATIISAFNIQALYMNTASLDKFETILFRSYLRVIGA